MVYLLMIYLTTVLVIHLACQITLLHSMLLRPSHFYYGFGRLTPVACYHGLSTCNFACGGFGDSPYFPNHLLHSMLIQPSRFHHGFGRATTVTYLIIMVYLLKILFMVVLVIHLAFQPFLKGR